MKKKIEIFCTLGPKTLNKNFLRFINGKVNLLRLNMSHIKIKDLENMIKFIKKNTSTPICIDTEGAQIRTRIKKIKKYANNKILDIYEKKGNFKLYPEKVFHMLKKGDLLSIGFTGLKVKILKIDKEKGKIKSKIIYPGALENNKGVHLINRRISLDFITNKDRQALEIAKKNKISNFALSFTSSIFDVRQFNKLLPNCRKIFKLENLKAIKNLDSILEPGKDFLIDRGDLSKETSIEKIPFFQQLILDRAKKKKVKVFVATNFLESMVNNPFPTRGEANDIYNTLSNGASGLVLAGETAVGNYSKECVIFLKKIIKVFKLYH